MRNKYANDFLDLSSKLDALINEHGEITRHALSIVDHLDYQSTIILLKKMNDISNSNNNLDVKLLVKTLKDSLIKFYGYNTVLNICNKEIMVEDNRTLSELLIELHNLVGLESVKSKVDDLIAYQKIQRMRHEKGLISLKSTLHLAFMGKPGTGKTTVARIIGRLYKKLGLLSKGHFVEVSRTDLIAGYQGQTALKVKKVIEEALGGVLFIDEAYSITENNHSDSYGRECITELTKALEDYREDLVVIVAGYTDPMNKFLDSNLGLKSRFNTFIEFEDYTAIELEQILLILCEKSNYILSEEAKNIVKIILEDLVESKEENFANGRLVRNIYDDLIMNHARRVANIENPSIEELSIIIKSDFKQKQLISKK
ncbi:stage V sporulation protein K [Exiguobacterium sp. PvP048]|uniref:AAA family ATPase n=1 Tax=unclassified Exiguobacterium TaxID=2644629 RepID=UPI0033928D54